MPARHSYKPVWTGGCVSVAPTLSSPYRSTSAWKLDHSIHGDIPGKQERETKLGRQSLLVFWLEVYVCVVNTMFQCGYSSIIFL